MSGALGRLFEAAERTPQRTLLITGERRYSFAEFIAQAGAVVQRLRAHGFVRGDRVALYLDEYDDFFVAMVGVWLAGGTVVPLNTSLPGESVTGLLRRAQPRFLLVPDEGACREVAPSFGPRRLVFHLSATQSGHSAGTGEQVLGGRLSAASASGAHATGDGAAAGLPETFTPLSPEDLAVIMFTSGTTGVPKGALQPLASVLGNAARVAEELGLTAEDRIFINTPPYFTSGICHFLTLLSVGGSTAAQQGFFFGQSLLGHMEALGCTGFGGAPAHLVRVVEPMDEPVHPEGLRFWVSSGDHLPLSTIDKMRAVLPGVALYNMYGLTEVSGRLCVLPPSELDRRRGSVGRPLPGMTVTVRRPDGVPAPPGEVGEIFVAGDLVMQGYLDEPQMTAEVLTQHGLRTGDFGHQDADGFVWLAGRQDDIFKRGGEKVSAVSVQQAVMSLGLFHDVAVIAADDEILGKVPVAFVVPREPEVFKATRVLRHLRGVLQPAWLPSRIVALDEIPRTGSGKPIRADLLARLESVGTRE